MAESAIKDVSDTAFWIAHYRAEESGRADARFRDPFAARLAGERGREIAAAMPMSRMMAWSVAMRTCIIDDYIRSAVAHGADAVLNLGAGLDTRPYRTELPASLLWVEADYPRIIEYKEGRLAGEHARCRLERVPVDLADLPQRRRLLSDLNARARRIVVLTEGVVPYLTVEEASSLADDLRALDHVAAWMVDYFSPEAMKFRSRSGMAKAMENAPFRFTPDDPFAFYAAHGWRMREARYLVEEGERLGRLMPMTLPMKIAMAFGSLFVPKARLDAYKKFTGFLLLEPAS